MFQQFSTKDGNRKQIFLPNLFNELHFSSYINSNAFR